VVRHFDMSNSIGHHLSKHSLEVHGTSTSLCEQGRGSFLGLTEILAEKDLQ
jgi:hypothetical protein